MNTTRRQFNRSALALLGGGLGAALGAPSMARAAQGAIALPVAEASSPAQEWGKAMEQGLAAIAAASGARLGVAVMDTGNGAIASLHGGERFAMCSTFKLLAAAAVLKRVDAHQEKLERRIVFGKKDLVPNSPATEKQLGGTGMSLAELCAAAIAVSDNTAANLILRTLGGPAGLTRYIRSLGDPLTRLDRNEPALNSAIPGDPRDTTTPRAMLGNLRTLLLGDALSQASRTQLFDWLKATQTSAKRLRAHLPADWVAGDKTGAGSQGSNNDIGMLIPPGRAPFLVTVYLTQTRAPLEQSNTSVAAVGRLIVQLAGKATPAAST